MNTNFGSKISSDFFYLKGPLMDRSPRGGGEGRKLCRKPVTVFLRELDLPVIGEERGKGKGGWRGKG